MKHVKFQYFAAFAVIGSLMPFLAVYLERVQGLNESQIGYTLSVTSAAILVTPVIMTLLADTRLDPRRLVAAIFLTSTCALLVLRFTKGFWETLVLLALHSLAYTAIIPLQDGINFSIQKKQSESGGATTPYHRIRVFGTLGFIVPSLVVFGFIRAGYTTAVILIAGIGFALIGLLNSFFVPDPRPAEKQHSDAAGENEPKRLPTVDAARALARPNTLVFCAAMVLNHLAGAAYIGFYPLLLTNTIDIGEEWIGLIFNLGVAIEIFFMLGFGHLLKRLGLKNILALGAGSMALRMFLLAMFPTAAIAIAAQAVHGLVILGMQVGPVMYVNQQAEDRYRNSIQGLYTMAVVGIPRVSGSIIAGQIAEVSLTGLFWYGGALSMLSALIFTFLFREDYVERH